MLLRVSAAPQPITYVTEFQPRYGLLVRRMYARHNAAFDRSFNVTRFVIAASSIRSIEFNKLDRRFHV
jgi:hypothetical protein